MFASLSPYCTARLALCRNCLCISLIVLVLGAGCAAQRNTAPASSVPAETSRFPQSTGSYSAQPIDPAWIPLYQRLRDDGLDGSDLPTLFASLELPSQDPMGRKIKELYTKAFAPKPKPKPPVPGAKPKPKPRLYPGVVTPANAKRCKAFLDANAEVFLATETTSGVPREIAVSLLFVETRLGDFLGGQKAFYTLASMASSRQPTAITTYLAQLPAADTRLDWIQERMEQRSDWAYKEFVALLKNARAAQANPLEVPGSIYGAVGLCQFMPSNISVYGADGDSDGVINLFTLPDALASLSNYLVKHGWGKDTTRAHQHKVIKTYNRVDIYANTILALADAVRENNTPPAR